MKFNMRETFLMTLLLVALVPIMVLSILSWWVLSKDEVLDKYDCLKIFSADLQSFYENDKKHLKSTLNDISILLDHFDYRNNNTQRSELQSMLATLKNTSSLDALTIIDTNRTVIARANSKTYGDKFESSELIKRAFAGETTISTEIVPDKYLKNEGKELLKKTRLSSLIFNQPDKSTIIDSSKGMFIIGVKPIFKTTNKSEVIGIIFAARLIYGSHFNAVSHLERLLDINIGIQPSNIPIKASDNIIVKPIYNIENKPIANLITWFDLDSVNKTLTDEQKLSFLMYVITSIIVLTASFMVSKYLVKPLELLDKATKEIAQDNFEVNVNVKGPVEIEDLSNAFNKMALSLSEKRSMQENFIATLTHDMRVPLLAEQKALNLILSDERFQLPKDPKILIENMISSNIDLLKLVNTMLDTYKLEAGKYNMDISEHNIVEIITETINELRPLVDDKRQSINFHTESDIMLICLDRDEMKRVVKNLISNSIKFTPKEGKIEVNLSSENTNITFSVADNGIGMSKEEMACLFKRYSSCAKKLKKIGTGLGLYLSYCIVLAHNGKMWVESELNKGSTFYVSLPGKI